jgi:hypothetical protein
MEHILRWYSAEEQKLTTYGPVCQAASCFEPASVYIVIKESDVNVLSFDLRGTKIIEDSMAGNQRFQAHLYLCARHDYGVKYLLKGNELEITRRRHLFLKKTE